MALRVMPLFWAIPITAQWTTGKKNKSLYFPLHLCVYVCNNLIQPREGCSSVTVKASPEAMDTWAERQSLRHKPEWVARWQLGTNLLSIYVWEREKQAARPLKGRQQNVWENCPWFIQGVNWPFLGLSQSSFGDCDICLQLLQVRTVWLARG